MANNLFNNTAYQADSSNCVGNQWYYDQIGNYYGDYLVQNPTSTNDGRVWSIPYIINGTSYDSDHYPLVYPFSAASIPSTTPGHLVWSQNWTSGIYSQGYGVFGYGTNVYTVGETTINSQISSFTLVKWDNTGQELWNRTLNGINSWGNAVWANQTNIITVGETLGFEGYQLTSMQLLLICWDVNGNQLWNITGTYPSLNQGTLVWGDNSNIYIIWYSTGYHLIKFDGAGSLIKPFQL